MTTVREISRRALLLGCSGVLWRPRDHDSTNDTNDTIDTIVSATTEQLPRGVPRPLPAAPRARWDQCDLAPVSWSQRSVRTSTPQRDRGQELWRRKHASTQNPASTPATSSWKRCA